MGILEQYYWPANAALNDADEFAQFHRLRVKRMNRASGNRAGLSHIEPVFPSGITGMQAASVPGMRQSVLTMEMVRLVGETEIVRKKERRARGRQLAFGHIRNVFALLFVATVFVFTFCYRADLQDYIFSNVYHWSQTNLKSSPLRQNALNYENEVNLVLE